ncbi:MAG: hypothetical protein QF579_02240 [Dehalococcoidia bacterium]|nr:hypothetical protein [Dehalococcoidia bacterium]
MNSGHNHPKGRPLGDLTSYYDRVDAKVISLGRTYNTAVGQFAPSPILEVYAALEYLLESGAIETSGLFLDAGSGDGRVVALAALVHGLPTVGVEYDDELVGQSRHHFESLRSLGLRGASKVILQGDFGDDDTYAKTGLRFEDFATVFNYINNHAAIALKIAHQSPPGTKFLLFGGYALHRYEGLTLEQSLQMVTRREMGGSTKVEVHPDNSASSVRLDTNYLQIYRR